LIGQIKNKENYLGITWLLSLFNLIIFFIPIASCLIAISFSSFGFPFEFLFESIFLFVYFVIGFMSSVLFIINSKSFSAENFETAFRYSVLPILSMLILVVFILICLLTIIFTYRF